MPAPRAEPKPGERIIRQLAAVLAAAATAATTGTLVAAAAAATATPANRGHGPLEEGQLLPVLVLLLQLLVVLPFLSIASYRFLRRRFRLAKFVEVQWFLFGRLFIMIHIYLSNDKMLYGFKGGKIKWNLINQLEVELILDAME